jgi:hypothetical protein
MYSFTALLKATIIQRFEIMWQVIRIAVYRHAEQIPPIIIAYFKIPQVIICLIKVEHKNMIDVLTADGRVENLK